MSIVFSFIRPFRYGLDGGFGDFDTGAGGNLDDGLGGVGGDDGGMDAACRHDGVSAFEAVAVGGLFLGLLALGTDEENVEDGNHGDNHDDGLPSGADG